jgi:DNA primase
MSYNHIEQIKARISPSVLISRYLQLKNKGNGEFLGLCPFHQENTPSFTVSDKKGFYHCFGCGANGDIFSFLKNYSGISYRDALEKLAAETGVTLPKQSDDEKIRQDKLAPLFRLFEIVSKFYHSKLYSREGADALLYLKGRGLSEDVIAEFNLGYAPVKDDELIQLLKKDFDEETIAESKVILKGNGMYSPFKGRVIFPISDRQGRAIAFGGRLLKDSNAAKYINSMENPIFHKGEVLYNMSRALHKGLKEREIIVVEGYMDVISLASVGISNAVAPLGANVKVEQIMQLWNFVDDPTICMDSDRAGQTACIRLAHSILPHIVAGKSVKFCQLKGAKDPDELIKKRGIAAMRDTLKKAEPLVNLLFESELSAHGAITPEKRLLMQNNLDALARTIKIPALSKIYQKFFNDKIFKEFNYNHSNKKLSKNEDAKKKFSAGVFELMSIRSPEVTAVLAGCSLFPKIMEDKEIRCLLDRLEIDSEELSAVRDFLVAISDEIDIIHSCSLEDEIKTRFDFAFDKKRLDPILSLDSPSISEVRSHVLRAGNIHNLNCIAKQIKEMESLLKLSQDSALFERLIYLKEQELVLLKQINFS